MNDRPTIGERYSSATESSDLRVLANRTGDADALIAAGWIADGFATSLYRLRTEYDAVKSEHQCAEAQLQEQLELARIAKHAPPPPSPGPDEAPEERAERLDRPAKLAEAIRGQARTDALTARVLILTHLKTLARAKDELGAFALGIAFSRPTRLNPDQVLAIAGRVLEVFLDPTCHQCDGRGFNGGTHRGEPQVLCRPCRGSGDRREDIGRELAECLFAAKLLLQLDIMIAEVDRLLRSFLRVHGVTQATNSNLDPRFQNAP